MKTLIFIRDQIDAAHEIPAEDCRVCFETGKGDLWAHSEGGTLRLLSPGNKINAKQIGETGRSLIVWAEPIYDTDPGMSVQEENRKLRALLREAETRFRQYEMGADTDVPYEHRVFMNELTKWTTEGEE